MNSPSFLRHFESLGDNCEFGFFLQEQGIHETSLFRWAAVIDYASVEAAISTGFNGIYQMQNLIPRTDTLVTDMAFGGIAFHTEMPIAEKNSGLEFTATVDERQPIHAREYGKFLYLAEKFRLVLEHERKIYVIKHEYVEPDAEAIGSLLRTLRRIGDASVLQVVKANRPSLVGKVKKAGSNHYIGYIDKFAGATFPAGISLDTWMKICERTWTLHTSKGLSGRMRSFLRKVPQDSPAQDDVPKWFDAKLYLAANPDVEAAGLDALEHYKNHGRAEGRPLRPTIAAR
ncbi:hypothetical protein [Paraburkholderia terrae]|uniref:hypothetical protein n=1 Tax=Paraburkholderia terrae TaxID=311230 RepID=UPI001EE1DAB2|nr:hypothetical protein [Paraburkholderia terrae]GJH02914.1 hypothetical protein CBA19C8_20175 [Paraburkholderia terrae]